MNNIDEQKNEAPGHNKEITIIVNGRPKVVTEKQLSFIQVVQLAFPDASINETTIYTVTYKKGNDHKPVGTMVEGESVKIKAGTTFNVTATDKS